ncbi:hypothetical protein GRI97_17235 [Altererythrobacter xixiisoli]|uniref:DUF2946 domain-containing protein n=2 Tax=Croceibacterium xixiisoli TaxID=1476466 RepID=A0A6I4TXI2_9SPHN|nr:hypothetical protein [Croceibacterium xixiisoli]
MFTGVRESRQLRMVFAVLLLLAFAARLIPAGYMPVVTPQGSLIVSLCTPGGVQQMQIALAGGEDDAAAPGSDGGDHDGQADGAAPCGFGVLAAPLMLAVPPLALAPVALPLREIALPPPVVAAAPYPFPHASPPSRGPPAHG